MDGCTGRCAKAIRYGKRENIKCNAPFQGRFFGPYIKDGVRRLRWSRPSHSFVFYKQGAPTEL
jgi:hypothetical protein